MAKHRRVRTLLLLFAIVGVFGWSYSVLLPAFATDVLRVGSREYGMLLSANGIGALCGALTVATYGDRLPRRLLVFGGLGLFSLMLLLLAVTRNYYLALVVHGDRRLGHAALLLHHQHRDPDECRRRHARARHGHLGAGVRRHDAGGRFGGRRPVALARRAVDGGHRRGGVRRRGPGDVVVCAPQPANPA